MLVFCLCFLGRRLTQSLQIWSAQRRHVNLRMWMKTVVTAFLCPTSRSTTTTSMISLKMLRLTLSDQSKRRDFKSVYAFWNTVSCWRVVCTKLNCIQVICGVFHVWDGSVHKLSCTATQLHPHSYTQLMCTTNVFLVVVQPRVSALQPLWLCCMNVLNTFIETDFFLRCTFKNPVFVRWLGGGTPVRNNEFMYVASKSASHSTLFIRSRNLAVADMLCRSSVHFHPINPKPCK